MSFAAVWVDLLKVSGIVRLRLLLDPSPPFVRTGTVTFPTLPLIEIAAAPLKRNLGQCSVTRILHAVLSLA